MNYDFSPSVERILNHAVEFIPNLVVAIIIFLATLWVSRLGANLVQAALKRRQANAEVTLLLTRISQWTIIVFGLIWALSQVNFDVTGFVAGLGIVGFTVGFALQDIAKNFVAGILLLIQQPFSIGDSVEVKGYGGIVTNIEIRSTTVRTWDGLLVIIPNADVYGNPITNYSKIDRRRVSLTLGVAYESDLQKVGDTLQAVAAQLPGVKQDPPPQVIFNEFGDPAIKVTLYFWIDVSETNYLAALDAAVKRIKAAFEQEGIQIPVSV
ncbi:MAG: mechanosensitive ion channel [Anaerolineae bacterium]|nr:mechanosensitive ion channel [Anaerolineae bacterium]